MLKIIGIILAFGLGYMTAYNELLAYMLQEVIANVVDVSATEGRLT